MSKRNNIIYWISTLWLSLGMASTGIVQCMQKESEVTFITGLGYPAYLLIIIGIWKPISPASLESAPTPNIAPPSGLLPSFITVSNKTPEELVFSIEIFLTLFLLGLSLIPTY